MTKIASQLIGDRVTKSRIVDSMHVRVSHFDSIRLRCRCCAWEKTGRTLPAWAMGHFYATTIPLSRTATCWWCSEANTSNTRTTRGGSTYRRWGRTVFGPCSRRLPKILWMEDLSPLHLIRHVFCIGRSSDCLCRHQAQKPLHKSCRAVLLLISRWRQQCKRV